MNKDFQIKSRFLMKRATISLSSRGLSNISREDIDNFTFIIGSDNYDVPIIFAEFISPNISRIRKTDKSFTSFEIKIEDEKKRFNFLLNLMNGKPINIDSVDAQMLLYFAEKLGNSELYDSLSQFKNYELSEKNAIPILLNKYRMKMDYDQEIRYVASHFEELMKKEKSQNNQISTQNIISSNTQNSTNDKIISNNSNNTISKQNNRKMSSFEEIESLSNLPLPVLEMILSSKHLKVGTEDDLFNFIHNLVEEKGKSYRILYEYVLFEYLDENSISQFVSQTTVKDINSNAIWNALSKRLMKKIVNKSSKNKNDDNSIENSLRFSKGSIPFVGDPFNGIVNYLKGQLNGENPNTTGQIKISYTSGNSYTEKLFDYEWKCYWSSTNSPGQWINFEFPKNKIYLTDYTLKTPNSRAGWNHLKNWVIEGSNDGVEWEEIDQRVDNDELNGNNKVATFHCKYPKRAKIIRLRQCGKNHRNADDIQLTNIEFFGRITDDE
ncbi:hypothetical protein TRFO_37763 [Tritrichomonas foetus]|uniref:F5/8 type C domain-containing protein n=1 Tax=Tritrichomonas foetus TaxID=1144522 RepID=A0A1J4JCW0_9EUKA|nr:hypothetical protein TRFO_37763 [Tritrichomonas foetus]|eukprot:OHS96095.1 hypothetical protein TRFO_37763 [Tritrichomonas foetus]